MRIHPGFLLCLCFSSAVFSVVSEGNLPAMADPAVVAQANPCAGKLASVGGPLAEELQGKPVVVDVFATWCAGCKNIEETLSQLKEDYADQVNFVVLDVTDKTTVQTTTAEAESLGLGQFLEETKSKTSTVAIIDPATGSILAMYKNNPNLEDYTQVLDAALAESSAS